MALSRKLVFETFRIGFPAMVAMLLAASMSACGGSSSTPAPISTASATPSAEPSASATPTAASTAKPTTGPTPTPTAVPMAFVVNSGDASILSFPSLDGNIAPGTRIAGPDTGLRMPLGIAIAANRLYVVNANPGGAGNLLVFLPGQNGDVTPTATISLGLAGPVAVATDATNDIYVLDQISGIVEFPPGPGSGTHPGRVISSYSGITNPLGITVDARGNIWVAEGFDSNANTPTAIYEFASDAGGAANPIATIAGNQTALYSATSIAFDAAGNLWVADMGVGSMAAPYQLLEFSAQSIAAGGVLNIPPTAAISGARTGLDRPTSIALDSGGNLWATNLGLRGTAASVLQFNTHSSGNLAPVSVLLGLATQFSTPQQIALYR